MCIYARSSSDTGSISNAEYLMSELRRTALYGRHMDLGAKLVPFSGWEMPVQYEGILTEHHAVRTRAGLFDVSHMGRVEICGPDAVDFVNRITVNDVERLKPFRSQYTLACADDGGVIDDFLVYRMPDRLLVIPNAGNREKDLAWFRRSVSAYNVEIRDLSEESMLIALQGPRSEEILDPLTEAGLDALRFQEFVVTRIGGIEARVFRTGYTGEGRFRNLVSGRACRRAMGPPDGFRCFGRIAAVRPGGKRYPSTGSRTRAVRTRDRRIDQSVRSRTGMDGQAEETSVYRPGSPQASQTSRR